MSGHDSMEQALGAAEADIDLALKRAKALTGELKKAKTAAAGGKVRDLRRSLEAATSLIREAAETVEAEGLAWDFDAGDHLSSGAWAKEVIDLAAERGLLVTKSDDRLVCYPSLVKVLPGDAAIEIDRRRERRVRPSVVVDALSANQDRPIRFRTGPFLEVLEEAYGWIVERGGERSWGAVVGVVKLWGILTLLPGSARDYTKPEFARSLYLLDQSGVITTKAGRTLRFSASTGTRNAAGVLTTVAADGRPVNYWGVAFT